MSSLWQSCPANFSGAGMKLRPEGVIDATVRLNYDGRTLRPSVRINCQNVSFAHKEFPFRLRARQRHAWNSWTTD